MLSSSLTHTHTHIHTHTHTVAETMVNVKVNSPSYNIPTYRRALLSGTHTGTHTSFPHAHTNIRNSFHDADTETHRPCTHVDTYYILFVDTHIQRQTYSTHTCRETNPPHTHTHTHTRSKAAEGGVTRTVPPFLLQQTDAIVLVLRPNHRKDSPGRTLL